MQRCSHRNIISLLGVVLEPLALVLELAKGISYFFHFYSIYFLGGTLQDVYESANHLDWENIFYICENLAEGLKYLHGWFSFLFKNN